MHTDIKVQTKVQTQDQMVTVSGENAIQSIFTRQLLLAHLR